MAPKSRGRLAIPTTKPLPDDVRIPSTHPQVFKTLSKLSRPALISLASQWCQSANVTSCGPYILAGDDEEDEEAPYLAATSIEAVQELYDIELPARKGSKREVVDHILEGDWRHGISLRQLAMVETQYILDHPTSNRWTAMRLSLRGESDDKHAHLPRFHGSTFLRTLQKEISPISKAHYYITKPKECPVTLLRIHLHDSPYNTPKSFQAITSSKTKSNSPSDSKSIFIIFPDGTPFIYVSVSSAGAHLIDTESRSLQKFAVEAVPKALSRLGERYELSSTAFTARSLGALLAHRGAERTNNAAGGGRIFADEEFTASALDYRKVGDVVLGNGDDDKENQSVDTDGKAPNKRLFSHSFPQSTTEPSLLKRRKLIAKGRFGTYGLPDDGKGLNRLDVRIRDAYSGTSPSPGIAESGDANADTWTPDIKLSFQGTHVFAGLRMLVENGAIDGEKMPGWLTGEGSVSIGTVKGGRIESANSGG
ncbi:CHL4-domain-containing protein [Tothia fuscella]|uniref:CHL4-domain-containing protein n=1 Tax=Tothia fuscella TaxID=1048955 RepID=A0A9P4NSL8_9PEZI|nr:CHL4-domain-containing protein [Tothia fuscella]